MTTYKSDAELAQEREELAQRERQQNKRPPAKVKEE
jgi:hypothetical protein